MIETANRAIRPRIGITMGDPAGVGPEVIVKALSSGMLQGLARFVVLGSLGSLEQAARSIATESRIRAVHGLDDTEEDGTIDVWETGAPVPPDLLLGQLDGRAGALAVGYIHQAAQLALDGTIDAICTAPVNKEAVELSGEHFTGHTELLAELTGADKVSMLLVAGKLRVAHVSTHVSLREAIDLVRPDRIIEVIELVRPAVQMLGIPEPRIAVAGLNPHAGEHGLFGTEETRMIRPAIDLCVARGWHVTGPHAPDSVFHIARQGHYDAVIAMYHDQGHVAIKMADFFGGVNVTLGLPVIRTSVDHGTGFDIAGKGIANEESMVAALRLAVDMATHRKATLTQ